MDLQTRSRTAPLWSCATLAARLQPVLPLTALPATLRRQLARLGIAAPVTLWHEKARQALPVAVRSWLETEFVSVQTEARRLKAPLWFVTTRSVKDQSLPA